MKFFSLAFLSLLVIENLQGSTLSHGRPARALNTTLRTNFSGIYERKNPCSGTDVETSLYKASQEFHHHTKDDGWSDYTHKCSTLIRNFLQTIGNLIRFNHEPNGSFNFYLNTSISQKQRVSGNPKSCESLPTIVIEATDCKIPLNSCCHTSRDRNIKTRIGEDGKCYNDQSPKEELLPSSDFPAQKYFSSQKTLPTSVTEQIPNNQCGVFPSEEAVTSVPFQYETRNPIETGESSCEDDNVSASSLSTSEPPTASPPSPGSEEITELEDFSQAVLYDLSRDTQSDCEPKTQYFKTSLRLTPQADPENGTIQPRIHYVAANVVTDSSPYEPAPQIQSENSFPPQGMTDSFSPAPFPGNSNRPIERTTPFLPPEYPSSVDASAFQSPIPNELTQLSVTPRPEVPFVAPNGEQYSTRENFPLQPIQSSESPTEFRNQTVTDNIMNPRFPFDPLRFQPTTATKFEQETPLVQVPPSAPQPFDVSSRPISPKFSSYQSQLKGNLFPLPNEGIEDMSGQNPQTAGYFTNVNDETLKSPPTLNAETADDSSFSSEQETLTFADRAPSFGNQLNAPVRPFDIQQSPPSYQQFNAQPPYGGDLPSTFLPPKDSLKTYEDGIPPTTQFPDYSNPDLEESRENDGMSTDIASQPSVTSYGAVSATDLPYSDSLTTSSPESDERTVPVGSPINLGFNPPNANSVQQAMADAQSNAHFRSSSTTTEVEEITITQDQTAPPGLILDAAVGQVPEIIPETFDQTFPSASNSSPDRFPQYPPLQAVPFTNTDTGDDTKSLLNSNQPMSSQFQPFQKKAEEVKATSSDFRSESPFSNLDYESVNSQKFAPDLNSNSDSMQFAPSLEPQPTEEYNLPPYLTTPMPYAPTQYPVQTTLSEDISQKKPSLAPTFNSPAIDAANYPEAGLERANSYEPPTQQTYSPAGKNFPTSSQQTLLNPGPILPDERAFDGPLVDYLDRDGPLAQPASDSYVRSDYLTTLPPQSFPDNIDSLQSFPDRSYNKFSDVSVTDESISESQFSEPPLERSSVISESSRPTNRGYINPSVPVPFGPGSPSTDLEGIPEDFSSPITPTSQIYGFQPEQQSFASTPDRRFQDQPYTNRISAPLTEVPEVGFSEKQFENDGNRKENSAETFAQTTTYTEQNVQRSSSSTTPVQAMQLPNEAQSDRIFSPQVMNSELGERNPEELLGSSEQFFDGIQTTDSIESPQSLSLDSVPNNSDTIQSPDTFSDFIGETTPANLPPVEEPLNQEFSDRPSALPNSFITSLPAGEQPPEINPSGPQFQISPPNSPDQLSKLNSQQLSPDLSEDTSNSQLLFTSPQPFIDEYPSTPETVPSKQSPDISPGTENRGLWVQTPQETSELSFDYDYPFPSETNSTNLLTTPQDESAGKIIPRTEQFRKSELQRVDEESITTFTPQAFIDNPLTFNGPRPPIALNPQSANRQQSDIFTREESEQNDFDQYSNTFADREFFNTDSTPFPDLQSDSTSSPSAVIPETSDTTLASSDQIATDSTEESFPEPFQTTPETQAFSSTSPRPQIDSADQTTTAQEQSFLEPEPQQLSNYPERNSYESADSFVPLSPQEFQRQSVPDTDYIDRPPTESLQTSVFESNRPMPSAVQMPPETSLDYPDQVNSFYNNRQNLQPDVEAPSSREEPQREDNSDYVSPAAPFSAANESFAQSIALRTEQENSQMRNQQPQRESGDPYSQPRPGFFTGPIPNSYNRNFPVPPRNLPLSRYSGQRPNYLPNPVPNLPQSRPPFYGQQPMPQIADSRLPPSEPFRQVRPNEGAPQSFASQSQPINNPDGQLGTSEESLSGDVSPPYLPNMPDALMPVPYPRRNPNYNGFRPDRRTPLQRYPINNNPRPRLPNQPNFPLYSDPRMEGAVPSQRTSPTTNQFVDDKQIIFPQQNYPDRNFNANSAREVEVLTDRRSEAKPETGLRPYQLPPELPISPPMQPLPTQENPLLQAFNSQLITPMQEYPREGGSFPDDYDQNESASFDRQNDSPIDPSSAAPPRPGQWNPQPATNLVNLQQNTAFVDIPNRPQPDPRALVPDQTIPSNEPGEDSVSYCGRDTPLLCLFDPAFKGNMTAPSYVILISKLPADADGEESVRVEKVYLGGEALFNCSWGAGKTFPTALYTPAPSAAASTVTLRTKSDFP